ncbi:MAG: dihydroneopterin aldolase [Acidobacteria bacterium]|nr:dihydroneopterin aldolase [Acidobacteriota bacterium]
MIGTTGLTQLRVDCIVGIYPHERAHTQTVLIDVELDYDFGPAATSDAIADAVDYDHVAAGITELLQARRFQLLEAMAEQSAAMLFERDPRIQAVRMTIQKPAAVPAAACSFVRVERARS